MKNNFIKILIVLGMLSVIIIGILIFSFMNEPKLTGETIFEYTHTRAVCDENNLCQDYEIKCQGNKVLDIKATGFIVQNPDDWEDPRNPRDTEQWCNVSE